MSKIDETHWRVDRRVPLAVMGAFLLQIAVVLIWATQLDARVNSMEQQTVSNTTLNEKFARLEERLDNMKQNIDGIKHQLNHLTDRLLKP